jgi:uncharacterized protein DUF6572
VSVHDFQQIDKVLYNETIKEVILLMVEDRDAYSSDKQLLELQEKFNTYVRYATEGLLAEHFPEWAGRPVSIRLEYKFAPDPESLDFLLKVEELLKKHRIKLQTVIIDARDEPSLLS